jgi:WD40 repeat protein
VRSFKGKAFGAAPLAFSRDGKRLFSGGWGPQELIWDVASGKLAGTLEPPERRLMDLALSPDGKVLASASDRTVQLRDSATGRALPAPAGARARIDKLALAASGKVLVTASSFDSEASVRLWDLATGRQRATLAGVTGSWPVATVPDGKTFAAGCYHGTPTVADASTGKVIRRCAGEPRYLTVLAYADAGKVLVGSSWIADTLWRWDVASGKELAPLGQVPQSGGPLSLVVSPDGRHLATGGMDRAIRLWDLKAGKEARQLLGQEGSLWSLAFSPDGALLAGVTAEGKFNFSANGTDRAIRVWEVGTGRVVRKLVGPPQGSSSVAWSPDGRVLATGGEDGILRLWEVSTGQERARLAGHEGPVSALAFTAGGGRLISGSSDTTVLVWDLKVLAKPARPPGAAQLPGLWADLAGADAARAFRAQVALASVPRSSVPFLKKRLAPVAVPDPRKLAKLIAELDDDRFEVREKATAELRALGERAATALRAVLRKRPSLEAYRRAKALLAELERLSVEQVRGLRAVEALERMGSAEARALLKSLAAGVPEARLTREARLALRRLR